MPRLSAAVLLAVLLAHAPAAFPRTASSNVQIASSAMLVLDARLDKRDVVLRIVRTSNHQPVEGAGNVTAQISGHSVPIVARGATYVLSTRGLKGGAHPLQVIVAHDGIHEVLSGTVTLPKRSHRFTILEKHGYGAWWVLNIVVLLLAARLIMRRKNKPPSKTP